jgi:hypothetical protein
MVIVRKSVAVTIAVACLAVPIGPLFSEARAALGWQAIAGYALLTFGGAISVQNFYLSFVRPLVYFARGGSADGYRNVSVIPLFGMLTIPGIVLAPPSTVLSVACIVLMLADTGNLLWFVVMVWRDDSFWTGSPTASSNSRLEIQAGSSEDNERTRDPGIYRPDELE